MNTTTTLLGSLAMMAWGLVGLIAPVAFASVELLSWYYISSAIGFLLMGGYRLWRSPEFRILGLFRGVMSLIEEWNPSVLMIAWGLFGLIASMAGDGLQARWAVGFFYMSTVICTLGWGMFRLGGLPEELRGRRDVDEFDED